MVVISIYLFVGNLMRTNLLLDHFVLASTVFLKLKKVCKWVHFYVRREKRGVDGDICVTYCIYT